MFFFFFSSEIELMVGGRMREGIDGEFGMDTLLYFKQITNKDLLYSKWYCVRCYVAAWMGGEFGGEWIHVHVWLSPFTVHLTLSLTLNWL